MMYGTPPSVIKRKRDSQI